MFDAPKICYFAKTEIQSNKQDSPLYTAKYSIDLSFLEDINYIWGNLSLISE